MTDDRTDRRAADLLPEERAAGSDDPQSQARAILADSDRREDRPETDEGRRSGEATTLGDISPSEAVSPGETIR
jgi:hypothetical protein